jgi:hypothetical protein
MEKEVRWLVGICAAAITVRMQDEKGALADCINKALTNTLKIAVRKVAVADQSALGDDDVEAALARSLQERRHSQV